MRADREVEELSVQLGDLRIQVSRTDSGYRSSASHHLGSPPSGAIARPEGAPAASGPETSAPSETESWVAVDAEPARPLPWTEEWEELLTRAVTPSSVLALDLSPVEHLLPRIRTTSNNWSPLARLGRALRAGVQARARIETGRWPRGSPSAVTLPTKIYIILRPAPTGSSGWTDDYLTYRDQVQGRGGDLHGDSVSHAFASRAEAEAYIIGAQSAWPPMLPRRR